MPYHIINGANLYFEEQGVGTDTIVFGHSLLFNLRMFDDQVNFLQSAYRCIRFDFRGQGKSEVTADGYDLDSLTEDTAQLITKLKCGPCHFIGFSMGGMVAMRMAIKYPELIKSLILIDTSSEPQDDMVRNRLLVWVARNFGLRILANKVMSMFFSTGFLQDQSNRDLVEIWKKHFLANDSTGVVKAVNGVIFRKGMTQALPAIKQPAIIMVGENDVLTNVDKSRILQQKIENSEMLVIPRAGHMAPVEEPEFVNQHIDVFLNKLND